MTVSTALDDQQRFILDLVAQLRASPRRRHAKMPELVEAVLLTITIEEMMLADPQMAAPNAGGQHRAAHTRARLALFRAVTSVTDSGVFERSLAEIHELFGARLRDLVAYARCCELAELARRIDELLASVRRVFGAPASADPPSSRAGPEPSGALAG